MAVGPSAPDGQMLWLRLTCCLCVAQVCGAASPAVQERAFGEWPSPISAEQLAAATSRYSDVQLDDSMLYWVETRPNEGRSVAMRRTRDGRLEAVTPHGFNVRTRVHEYGGSALLVVDGVLYFTNFDDQQLYRQRPGEAPRALTRERGTRYANCAADLVRKRLVCVREDHRAAGEPRNALVAVSLGAKDDEAGVRVQVLFGAADFVSNPAISADGARIAFIAWDHPNMPWDRAVLWVARFGPKGELLQPTAVNQGSEEAPLSPLWSRHGSLYYVSDRNNWWNFHEWRDTRVREVSHAQADLGMPAWGVGQRTNALLADGRMFTVLNDHGVEGLGLVDPVTGRLERLSTPVVAAQSPAVAGERAYFEAGFADRPHALVQLNLNTLELSVLRAPEAIVSADYVSHAQPIEFATGSGERSYGFFYPPFNAHARGPSADRPPLIVTAHGGPTLHTTPALSVSVQFWTSRGFAVLDVNYRGSTGFGRAYRHRLYGHWGEVDVEDVVNGARRLVADGLVDPDRLIIRGGSAGGFTAMAAMAFHDVFKSGAVYAGVSDLATLRSDTHKFESRYLDSLIGQYPLHAHRYRSLSPINHLDRLSRPMIILQGSEDEVVPPSQSRRIFSALRARGTPAAYLEFEGEGHGFVSRSAIARARQAELYFYGRVFGFEPADPLPVIEIENEEALPRRAPP